MYYIPKDKTFIIENMFDEYVILIDKNDGDIILAPGERREIISEKMKLYQDDDGSVHMGCWPIAVEVDGKRHEYAEPPNLMGEQ